MVSLADIRAAEQKIAGHIIRTPLIWSPSISARTGARVYLKLETFQKAGSFKVRERPIKSSQTSPRPVSAASLLHQPVTMHRA